MTQIGNTACTVTHILAFVIIASNGINESEQDVFTSQDNSSSRTYSKKSESPTCWTSEMRSLHRDIREEGSMKKAAIVSQEEFGGENCFLHNIQLSGMESLDLAIRITDGRESDAVSLFDTTLSDHSFEKVLVAVDSPGRVIQVAEKVFHNRGRGSLLPHRLRFIIFYFEGTKSLHEVFDSLKSSVFDNIALLVVKDNSCQIVEGYTLMWRENRTREFERIATNLHNNECWIFPNLAFGMNKRTLLSLAKPWPGDLITVWNDITKTLEFSGFLVDLLDSLALNLNFSYRFIPDAEQSLNMSWGEYVAILYDNQVDFGASLWYASPSIYFNHTTTWPVHYETLAAAYLRDQSLSAMSGIFNVFEKEIYFTFVGSFLLASLFYVIHACFFPVNNLMNFNSKFGRRSSRTCSKRHVHRCESRTDSSKDKIESPQSINQVSPQDLPRLCDPYSSSAHFQMEDEVKLTLYNKNLDSNLRATSPDLLGSKALTCDNLGLERTESCVERLRGPKLGVIQTVLKIPVDVASVVFGLLGSVFNQSSLPPGLSMSVRFLLWSWSLLVLILSALYTGSLTAGLVDQTPPKPFSTIDEMMDRGDFRWGGMTGFSYFAVMEASAPGTTLRRLTDGMQSLGSFYLIDEVHDEMKVLKDFLDHPKSVVIHPRYRLEYVKNKHKLHDLEIFHEILLKVDSGIIFYNDAELVHVFSLALSQLREAGLIDYYNRKWRLTEDLQSNSDKKRVNTSLGLQFTAGAFVALGVGIGLAVIAIICECFVYRIVRNRRKSQEKSDAVQSD